MNQMPVVFIEPHQPPRPVQRDLVMVPARVDKAMEFLALMVGKQTDKPATEHMTIEGLKLTEEEQVAAATACNLLSKYFAGQLPTDEWDKLRLRKVKRKKRRVKEYRGKVVTCPNCAGNKGYRDCQVCGGAGRVLVQPLE